MADHSLVGSAILDINKIKAKLGEIQEATITLTIENAEEILTKIGNIKTELEGLEKNPYTITVNLAGTAEAKIQDLQTQLNNINKQSAKQAKSQQRANRKSGGSSKKLEQSAGFPVSRRKWAQKYSKVADDEEKQIIQSLLGRDATLIRASGKQRFDKTGKEVGSDWLVTYRNELGKTVSTMLQSTKALDENGKEMNKWKVLGTNVNANYEAQRKYLEDIKKQYDSVEKSAFSSKDALDRNSPFGAAATSALENYKKVLDEVVKKEDYSEKSRDNLSKLKAEAQTAIEQQKALRDAQQYRDTYYTKQKAEYDKRYSEAFVQGINGTPLKDQFKKNAEGYFDTWNNELTKIQNQTTKVTAEQENKIFELRAKAMLAAKEQQHAQAGGSTLVGPDITSKVSTGFTDITLLEEKLKQTGQYTNEAKVALDGFRESLARAENVDQFNAWNDSFKVLKGQIAEVQAETKTGVLAENFKLDTEALSKEFKSLKQQYNEIWEAKHTDLLSEDILNTDLENGIEGRIERITELMNNINPQNISTVRKEINALKDEMGNLEMPKDISSNISDYASKIDLQIESLKKVNQYSGDTKALIDGLKDSLYQVQDEDGLKQWAEQYKVVMAGIKQAQAEAKTDTALKSMEIDARNLTSQFDNLVKKYREITSANPSKADAGIEGTISRLQDMFNNLDVSKLNPDVIKLMRKELTGLGRDINGLQPQTLSQVLTQNLGGVGQYLARFTSAFYIINKGIQTVKSMVNEVKSLDTSLMELQKVTSLSGDSLAQFTDNAYKTGKEVGRTGKDVIDAVTTFSRAGYNLEESNELAKAALTMTNVGVDIPNTEAAASDMISILKAFDKQADESMQVIDELYNVANKEPLDFGNITQMLVTAGGTLAQTNTSLEETMGLLTGGFATLRDESVANGLIMISQRLRGVKEDGEAIEEEGFMPKLKKAFGDVGISIEDQNGELRSTYDILNDLAGVWDQLSSKQRQYLGEKAAGNRQVKTLNAIMSNWDVVQDTIQKANEATGEATKGNEKYLDSIEGRITQFKSAFSDLARTTIDSGFIKGIVSIGTGFLNITKNAGGLVPVLTTIVGIVTVLKGAKIAEGLTNIVTAFKGLTAGFTGLTSGIGIVGAIIAAISTIALVANSIKSAQKSISETASAARQSYSDQKSKVESLNSELENTQSLMADLESKGSLTVVEQDEYNRLKETNDQLERQIALEQARLKISQREARETTAQELKQYNESTGKKSFDPFGKTGNRINEGLFEALGKEWFDVNLKAEHRPGADLYKEYELINNLDSAYIPSTEELVKAHSEALLAEKQNLLEANKAYYSELAKYTDEKGNLTTEDENILTYIGVLEDAKDAAEGYVKESETFLNDYLTYLEEKTAGISKVENATPGSLDAYFNSMIEQREQIADLLLTSSAMDMSKGKQADIILAKYTEAAQAVQDLVKEAGQITAEDLGSDTFKELTAEFEKYGWSIDEVATHLTEFYKEQEKIKEFPSTTEELIKNNYLASESYKALTEAMAEQEKAGSITAETFKKITADKELAKYLQDTEGALRITANGLELNTDAMQDYIEIQNGKDRIEALALMQKDIALLEEAQIAMQGLTDENERAQKLDEVNSLQNEITALQAYVSQLDNATSALERYQNAKKTSNQDAAFNVGQNVYKDIKEGRKTGKTGTDDFKDAVGFILGPNWEEDLEKRFPKGVEQAYSEAEKLGKRYFGQKDERTGMTNFMKDLSKATDKEGRKLAEFNAKTGEFKLGVKANGESYSLEEIGNALGIYEEAVSSLFGLMETYDYDVEYEPFVSQEDQKAIDEYNTKVAEQEQTVNQLKENQIQADKELADAQKAYDSEATKANKEALDAAQKKSDLNAKALEQEQSQLDAMKEGNTKPVETMSIQEALSLFEQLQNYADNGIPINLTPTGQYETVKAYLESLRVLTVDVPVDANTDDANPKLDETQGKLDRLNEGADSELSTSGNAAEDLNTANSQLDTFGEGATSTLSVNGNAQDDLASIKSDIEDIEGSHNITFNVDYNDPLDYKKGNQKYAEDALSGGSGVNLDSIGDQFTLYISALRKNVEAALRDMSWAKKWMQNIQQKGGNVDLLNRPIIPASKLTDMGYDAGEDGIATLFSHSTNIGENGEIGVVLTPILPDGDVLEPSTMDSVLENLFVGSDGKIQLPEGDWGFNLSDILVSSLNLSQMPTEMRGPYMEAFSEALHQVQEAFYSGGESIDVPLTVEEDSGKNIHDQIQEQLDTQSPVKEQVVQQSQPVQSTTPVNETKFELDLGNIDSVQDQVGQIAQMSDELAGMASEAGASAGSINALNDACAELITATSDLGSIDMGDPASVEAAASSISTAASNFNEAYNKLSAEIDAMQTVNVGADTSSAERSIDALGNKTVTVTVVTNEVQGNAKGTRSADPGLSLVDEKGAELIEHTRRGTYELGTNNGPRLTNLEAGDVVHTASETKRILSRLSAVGGFFRDGLNQAKSILTGGAFDTGVKAGGKNSAIGKSSNKKKSSKKSSKKKSSSKSSKVNMKKLQEWFEKLFDWAEIRLERLQTITDEWIYKAGQAIGYAAQNTQLANAMKSVENQIKDTTAAYNLYIAQADKVAKKTKLSADIINRIQNGTIEISSYSKDTQEKIKQYQTFYDKAIACKEALQDLNEQEQELAKTRLDNVIQHFTNRANVYENIVKQREAQMNLAEAQGREQFASDYNASITATNNKLNTLVQERTALNNEFNSLVAKGYIKKDSDAWFEYSEKIRDLDTEIITVKNDIIDLHDAANQVALTKLSYQLDQLANSASHVDEMINLHSAQAIDEYAENFKTLIDNGMDQIKNLQAQNAEYRKQQQGLDVMSAKYQELEQSIQSNITAINQMKVSQEGWNDSVYDIQIGKINDFKDQLSKTNELYERQKSLQEAIQELEKARSQRTQRVFHAGGTGFVYEADQEAVKDAQESLEDVIQDELMSKMDDLIDALEEQKDNNNIYDANGNLLGTQYVIPQLDNLSEILSNYYSNPNNAPSVDAIRKLFMDELVSNSNTSNNNQASINIGDIIIQEAENGNDLANAIINQLPNALLQALYKKS